jgi:hypothetical protein
MTVGEKYFCAESPSKLMKLNFPAEQKKSMRRLSFLNEDGEIHDYRVDCKEVYEGVVS